MTDVLTSAYLGLADVSDREIAAVLEKHCQAHAFIPPPALCVHGGTDDCLSCFLDHDQAVHRSADL